MKDSIKNYYIFTGIDGTLNTTSYCHKNFANKRICKESIDALNFLIEQLKIKGYTPRLVVTSSLRYNYELMCKFFENSGLVFDGEIETTKWVDGPRGKKILSFLREQETRFIQSKNPFDVALNKVFFTKPFCDYVVIDGVKEMASYIPKSRHIEPDCHTQALNTQMIEDYLIREGIIESESEM
ncbi:MAG: hypothetical protein IJW24_04575 [Clostridia bacterium]|nr:hypothetical protein [Clostridia bacterium]